jgi:hypothetical protein
MYAFMISHFQNPKILKSIMFSCASAHQFICRRISDFAVLYARIYSCLFVCSNHFGAQRKVDYSGVPPCFRMVAVFGTGWLR